LYKSVLLPSHFSPFPSISPILSLQKSATLIVGDPNATTTDPEGVVLIEGYLSKLNKSGRWDKRWFVLKSKELKLKYYHNKPSMWRMEEKPVEACNLLYIESVHPTAGSKSAYELTLQYKVTNPDDKAEVYNLKAESAQNMSKWTQVMTGEIMKMEEKKKKLNSGSQNKLIGPTALAGSKSSGGVITSDALNASRTGLTRSMTSRELSGGGGDIKDKMTRDTSLYGIPKVTVDSGNDDGSNLLSSIADLALLIGSTEYAHFFGEGATFVPELPETHGEISSQLTKYCINDLGIGLRSRLVAAIACMHTSILSPAINDLAALAAPHRFSAVAGSWRIKFSKNNKGEILIHHTMKEESASGENLYFNFEWKLVLRMNAALTVCNSRSLSVVSLSFSPDGSAIRNKNLNAKQSALRDSMKPLFNPALEYENIHTRPISELATAKDIPRLVWGIHISSEGKNLFQVPPEEVRDEGSEVLAISKCLLALTKVIKDRDSTDFLKENISSYLPSDTAHGMIDNKLLELFKSEGLADSKFLGLLKAINQDIIAPAVISLRLQLHRELPYQDVPNSWRVCVRNEEDGIHVNHCKWEQLQGGDTESSEYFKFEWMLDLTVSEETMKCVDAKVWVMNYEFGTFTSETQKSKVENFLKTRMPEGRPYTLTMRKVLASEEGRKSLAPSIFEGNLRLEDCDICASSSEENH
jgi:hypothetical protein